MRAEVLGEATNEINSDHALHKCMHGSDLCGLCLGVLLVCLAERKREQTCISARRERMMSICVWGGAEVKAARSEASRGSCVVVFIHSGQSKQTNQSRPSKAKCAIGAQAAAHHET